MTAEPRVIVTGVAGFIGSHLAEALLETGHRVIGIDSFSGYYDRAQKRANLAGAAGWRAFELLVGDLNTLDLTEVLQPGDLVFHLAAQPGVRASWGAGFGAYVRANISATQRLLEAARERAIHRLVFASSSSVYGQAPTPMAEDGPRRPMSPYGVTKLSSEELCLAYARSFQLDVVPLRFFSVYGPRQRPDMGFHRFIEAVIDGEPLSVYGDGDQTRDFTHVGDVVRILIAAAERGRPGLPVNVGGGSPVSVNRAIAIIERLVGRPAVVNHEPAAAGDPRETLADTTRLKALDEPPTVGIEAGLASQVAWHLERRQPVRRGADEPQRPLLMYSHDTYGLGHLRRNLAIAHAVRRRRPDLPIVMLTGSVEAGRWSPPTGVEMVRLPTAVKAGTEDYRPASERSLAGLRAERRGILLNTVLRTRPAVILVDHAPLGMKRELLPALAVAREGAPDTTLMLGLRDILDDPVTVRATWQTQGVYGVLEDLYDQVVVYGCQALFDVVDEYALPAAVAAKTRFAGYVAKAQQQEATPQIAPWDVKQPGSRILVVGGGGADAGDLFRWFLAAWPAIQAARPVSALLVAGPLMSEEDFSSLRGAAELPGLRLLRSTASMLHLVAGADAVVSMSGYNSVVEALTARKPLVLMPRVAPRREQLIRARIFEAEGLARVVLPDADTKAALASAVLAALDARTSRKAWDDIDLGGAERTADTIIEALPATEHAP